MLLPFQRVCLEDLRFSFRVSRYFSSSVTMQCTFVILHYVYCELLMAATHLGIEGYPLGEIRLF
jgi:hypothetical protein